MHFERLPESFDDDDEEFASGTRPGSLLNVVEAPHLTPASHRPSLGAS
jgi:hypothetical protein